MTAKLEHLFFIVRFVCKHSQHDTELFRHEFHICFNQNNLVFWGKLEMRLLSFAFENIYTHLSTFQHIVQPKKKPFLEFLVDIMLYAYHFSNNDV